MFYSSHKQGSADNGAKSAALNSSSSEQFPPVTNLATNSPAKVASTHTSAPNPKPPKASSKPKIDHHPLISLYKSISWRCIGSMDTFVIAWFISGKLISAGLVALIEFLTKPVLYYLHDRIWTKISYGVVAVNSHPDAETIYHEKRRRSIAKTISWRITATLDTTLISFIVTGNPAWAIAIGSAEMLTKTILFYYHERMWVRIQKSRQAKNHVKNG